MTPIRALPFFIFPRRLDALEALDALDALEALEVWRFGSLEL